MVYLCSNKVVGGVAFPEFHKSLELRPEGKGIILSPMSSSNRTGKILENNFSAIFFSSQKSLVLIGVGVVILRRASITYHISAFCDLDETACFAYSGYYFPA
jgi:phosphoserine aminotransferase